MIRAILTSGSMRSLRHKPDRSCAPKPEHISCYRQGRAGAVVAGLPGAELDRPGRVHEQVVPQRAAWTRQDTACRVIRTVGADADAAPREPVRRSPPEQMTVTVAIVSTAVLANTSTP